MTSTPVSLNDESLNGSWIDINSASQIHSPMDDDSPEFMRPPYSLAESVQNLGLISFQVERFLQEANKSSNNSTTNNNNNDNNNQPSTTNNNGNNAELQQNQIVDNISDIYLSDSDVSAECLQESKTLIDSLRRYNERLKNKSGNSNNNNENQPGTHQQLSSDLLSRRLSKGADCLTDQLSDSLSLLSRASFIEETNQLERTTSFEDFDWLWDWTAQPEYFSGQEWKVNGPKQEYLLKRRQMFCSNMATNPSSDVFSGEMMSLLVLTNLLSIIIGAGLTYSILMRRSSP